MKKVVRDFFLTNFLCIKPVRLLRLVHIGRGRILSDKVVGVSD